MRELSNFWRRDLTIHYSTFYAAGKNTDWGALPQVFNLYTIEESPSSDSKWPKCLTITTIFHELSFQIIIIGYIDRSLSITDV